MNTIAVITPDKNSFFKYTDLHYKVENIEFIWVKEVNDVRGILSFIGYISLYNAREIVDFDKIVYNIKLRIQV